MLLAEADREIETDLTFLREVLGDGTSAYAHFARQLDGEKTRQSLETSFRLANDLVARHPEFGASGDKVAVNFERAYARIGKLVNSWVALESLLRPVPAGGEQEFAEVPCCFREGTQKMVTLNTALFRQAFGRPYAEDAVLQGVSDPRVPWDYAFPGRNEAAGWEASGQMDSLAGMYSGGRWNLPKETRDELSRLRWIVYVESGVAFQTLRSKDGPGVLFIQTFPKSDMETEWLASAGVHECRHLSDCREYGRAPKNILLLEARALADQISYLKNNGRFKTPLKRAERFIAPYPETAATGNGFKKTHFFDHAALSLSDCLATLPDEVGDRVRPIVFDYTRPAHEH